MELCIDELNLERKETSRGVEMNDFSRTPFFSCNMSLQFGLNMKTDGEGSINGNANSRPVDKPSGGECLEKIIHSGIEARLDFNIASSRLRLETY